MDTMVHLLTKFQSRLTAAITPTATEIVLESVTDIPTTNFMAILDDSKSTAECVWVTAVVTATKTITVTRAQRGTTAVAHVSGTLLFHSEVALGDLGYFEVWETAGETGRPLESRLITDVLLGGYANGFKGYVDCNDSGGSTGLLSGLNGEIRLPNGAGRGAYYGLESEVVFQTSSTITPWGSDAGFLYCGASGAGIADFDTDGKFMLITGLTPAIGKLLSADMHTLKTSMFVSGTHYAKYLVQSIAENYLSHSFSVIAADDRIFKLAGSWATPDNPDGEGIVNISANITGATGGEANLCSAWLNLGTDATIGEWSHIHTDGFYDATATLTGAHLAWAKYAAQLASDPQEHFIMDLNMTGANSGIDAIYNVNDPALALGDRTGYASHGRGRGTGRLPAFRREWPRL